MLTPRARVIAALYGRPVDRLPVVCMGQTATMEQWQRLGIDLRTAMAEPEAMARLAASAHTTVGLEAVCLPFDQTLQAEALGCRIQHGGPGELPQVAGQHAAAAGPPVPPGDFLSRGRIPAVLEGLRRLRLLVGGEVPVVGRIVGPFTLAGQWLGVGPLLTEGTVDPIALEPVLAVTTQCGLDLALAMLAAGADMICVDEDTASPEVISPATFHDLILPFLRPMFSAIDAPVILQIGGNVGPILGDMAATGALGLCLDARTPVALLRPSLPNGVAVLGDLSPAGTLLFGTPGEVVAAARTAAAAGVDLLAPGCSLATNTPLENLRALVAVAHQLPGRVGAAASPADPASEPSAPRAGEGSHPDLVGLGWEHPTLGTVHSAVVEGRKADIHAAVSAALERIDPLCIIQTALVPAMHRVGEMWRCGEYFLPQVLLAADTLQAGMDLCQTALGRPVESRGRVLMHVPSGDYHSIGKNIVKALLSATGFTVVDMGVNVAPADVVAAVRTVRPHLITGSALVSAATAAFAELGRRLQAEGLETPIACGGGAVTRPFCETFPLGIFGGRAENATAIAAAAAAGTPWMELRRQFHPAGG